MKKILVFAFLILSVSGWGQDVFKSDSEWIFYTIKDGKPEKVFLKTFPIDSPGIIEVECHKAETAITISGGKSTTEFTLSVGEEKTFGIEIPEMGITYITFAGVEPTATFSDEYIAAHRGKNIVEIPEVSELINILLVLHKDAEKDSNMFDTKSDYYQRVKKHFAPYRNHRAVKIIEAHMSSPLFYEQMNVNMFPTDAYKYYYNLKQNACAYEFDKKGRIKNKGQIREISTAWHTDPMKDVEAFEDFARVSKFRQFYKKNKPYYDQLIATFNRLNPIDKMKKWLDSKFGFGYSSSVVYFSPLNKGAQATAQFSKGDFYQAFMFVCKAPEYPEYSASLNELLSSWIIFTEIDHNYVNPVSDKNLKYIDRVFSKREKWAADTEATAIYSDPYDVFNEYMTFAVYTLYAIDNYSHDDVMKFLSTYEPMMENVRGFIRFSDFNRALLERYQKNPDADINSLFQYMMYWALQINDKE